MRLAAWSGSIAASVAIAFVGAARATGANQTSAAYRLDTYALQINGDAQFVTALDGGFFDGTVVTTTVGTTQKKHLAGVSIEPIHAKVKIDQFTSFLEDSLDGKADSVNGSIFYIDGAGKVQQQRDMTGAMLTELAFPVISATSKSGNALLLGMTLTPQSVKAADVLPGALPPVKMAGAPNHTKAWAGMFRFDVPGLPTNRVSTIEAFTIRRKIAPPTVGQMRDTNKSPAPWEIPNLVFYMPPQDSQAWLAWHDDFVVKGNCTEAQEKTFTLDLLTPDAKDTILELQGTGVGIVSAKYEQPVGMTSSIQGFRVELYVQSMKLVAGGATAAAAPAASPANTPADTTTPKTIAPGATSRPMRLEPMIGTRKP